ncbi:MAG: mechanosensitive ion channel [Bacteroidales bacterium]|nr:mechanosensitive ion channel [Bacteroidales bacterium]
MNGDTVAQAPEANGVFIDFARWLLRICGVENTSEIVATLIMVVLSTIISISFYWIAKALLFKVVRKVVAKTPAKWDDYIFNDKVLTRASFLPSIFSMMAFGLAMHTDNWLNTLYMKVVYLYMTLNIGRFILAAIDAGFDLITATYPKVRSLKSVKQLLTYVIVSMMLIVMIGIVIDKNPSTLLAGLGASAAVMSLVFKETIQSLVSGIQLSANNMVAVGDWIVVPKANANGVVTEMNLNTVKIRNWDNTITTVPPSTLMSDAFTNWKGMSQSAGRRLNRSVLVDMATVRFISDDEARRYENMPELYYFFQRRKEGAEASQGDLTNLTLFREYMLAYLLRHPQLCDPDAQTGMMVMVRYLQPTQYGLPVEMYCFTKTKVWKEHEAIISELVDHMIAALGTFGLRAYQVASSETGPGELGKPMAREQKALPEKGGEA